MLAILPKLIYPAEVFQLSPSCRTDHPTTMTITYSLRNPIRRCLFIILLALLLAGLGRTRGMAVTFTNQMDASLVLGKSSFTGGAAASPAASLRSPAQCIISPSGKLIVSEQGGTGAGRVVIWNSVPTTNGAAADVVLGRTSFTDTVTGTTAIRTNQVVSGVLATPDGKLIITDDLNNRVLIWNSIPSVSGTAADVVIGQTSMTAGTAGISASTMNSPRNVLLTPDGKLLVSDYGNSRVLIFNSVPTSNGATANVVIGQSSLTTRTRGLGASECGGPYGLALSSTGRLAISDLDVHRVLIYNTVPTSNGAAANVVIGQTGFGLEGSGTTAARMNLPGFIGISPTGQLAVGEISNHRVIIFNSIPTTNGAAANVVLGQPNFTTGLADNGGTSAHSLYNPCASFTPDGRLFVGDRFNGRVLVFGTGTPAVMTPTITGITSTAATLGGNVVTDGGAAITERGVVYSLTSANADPLIGGSGVVKVIASGTTGVFALNVAGLSAGSGYRFKAYATNGVGTNYTSLASFNTLNTAPTDITLSNASVAENNPANAVVGSLAALDLDAGQTHTFAFAGGADDGAFGLAGNVLTINGRSDFETKSSYTVRIRATDSGSTAASFEKNFVITITDADETPGVVAWDDFLRAQDSGGGWASNWNAASTLAPGMAFPGLNFGGYAASAGGGFFQGIRSLPAQTTGVVYLSALVRGTGYCNVTLYNNGGERVGFGGIWTGSGPTTVYGTLDVTSGAFVRTYSTVPVDATTRLLLVRVDLDANTASVWIDPNLAVPLGAPLYTTAAGPATYDFNQIRLEISGTAAIDELRVVRWEPELLETQTTSPAVSAPVAVGVTHDAAALGATVAGGGLLISQVGVVYAATSVDADPNPGDPGVLQVSGVAFPVGIAGLSPGVTYSFKAYATNANGTMFTDVGTFTTAIPAVIAWDDFLSPQDSGGGWAGNWTVALPDAVNLAYPGLNSGGYGAGGPVNFPGAYRDVPPQTTGVVYLSALVSGTSYANVTLYNGSSELIGFGIVWSGFGPSTQYGAYDNTRGVRSYSTVNVDGGTHLFVVRVDLDANTISGWVDPNLSAPQGAPMFSSNTNFSTGYDFNKIRLEIGPGSKVDELRVVRADPELLETQVTSPSVLSPNATSVGPISAILGGNVVQTGGLPLSRSGIVFSRTADNANPFIEGNSTSLLDTDPTASGVFALPIGGLTPNTQYSYRAFAANALGLVYTSVATFTTLPPSGPPAVDDAINLTSGNSVLYPLANDGNPSAVIVSVSNPLVLIDGRMLIVPAGFAGAFTYTTSDGHTATVTMNIVAASVAPQRFSGLLYNSAGAIVGRAVTNRTAAGINTFSAQIGSAAGKSVFVFPASGNSAMGISTALGSVSATLGEDGHLLVTMSGGISGDLRPTALSPATSVYNVGLAPMSTSLKGTGFGTVRIGSRGAGKILVKMPDGRAFSAATEMADNGSITFYGRQAATTPFGYVGGEFIFADLAKTDLTGEMEWKRPPQFSRMDRAAVNTIVVANGCIANGTFGFPDGAATMTFSGGNYAAPAVYAVTVGGGAVVPFLPTLRFWTPIAISQTFKFRFLQPGRTIDSTGTGMYFQKSQTALGYFPGLLLSGKVELKQP